ncbi:MAG: hypothetical protein ACYC4L_00750 [Chloroflexota bacterium]
MANRRAKAMLTDRPAFGPRGAARVTPIPASAARRDAGVRFDWLMVLLAFWVLAGATLDGWAHTHVPDLETFFTPWHAVLYSGFVASATVLLGATVLNRRRGLAWPQAVPGGYETALVGVAIFAVGGFADMVWHILFGIEVDIEAELSPTHLLLGLGEMLIILGIVRAVWGRRREVGRAPSWADRLPAVFALAFLALEIALLTQYAHPWGAPLAEASRRPVEAVEELTFTLQGLGVSGVLLQTVFLMTLTLLAARLGRLPVGAMTIVLALPVIMVALMRDQWRFIPSIILAGVLADLLLWRLRPGPGRPAQLRLFAFAVPVIVWSLYFATLALTGGVWWTIHLWAGAIVLGGLVGLMIGYLVAPPALAEESS